MPIKQEIVVQSDWMKSDCEFRKHALILVAHVCLNSLLQSMNEVNAFSVQAKLIRGASRQFSYELVLKNHPSVQAEFAIYDYIWPNFRLGVLVRTSEDRDPCISMLVLAQLIDFDLFQVRHAFTRFTSVTFANWKSEDSSKLNKLTNHVPLLATNSSEAGIGWKFLGSEYL